MSRAVDLFMRAQEAALCLVNKWWRPCVCAGIGGSVLVNGVIIPLAKMTPPDLSGLAMVIGAAAPFAVMRGFEKKWGVAGQPQPSEPTPGADDA